MPFVVEHDRGAVEHQLVLTTDLVDVDDCRVRVGGASAEHAFTLERLAGVERRCVDVDAEFGTGSCLFGNRAERAPDVLTDRDADLHAADHVQLQRIGLVTGREVARLVEDGGIGEQALVVPADDVTVRAHGRGVVEVPALVDEADHGGASAGPCCELRQHGQVVGHESGLEHQILRRIAGDGQLREHHDVASGGVGAVVGIDQLRQVPVEVAHGRVELGERHSQHRHDRAG